MDGMVLEYRHVTTGGRGPGGSSNTIHLPAPTSAIAEISLQSFEPFGRDPTVFTGFTACTTDGSDGLPPSENFTLPGVPFLPTVLIRNGLKSLTYVIDIENCRVNVVINVFFWPHVIRG